MTLNSRDSARPPAPPSSFAPRRARVLVVDGDREALEATIAALSPELDVKGCASGERALRAMEIEPFDVVCAASTLPGMSGPELLAQVAASPAGPGGLLLCEASEYTRPVEGRAYRVLLRPFEPARLAGLVVQLARVAEMKRKVRELPGAGEGGRDSAPPSSLRPSTAPPARGRLST